MATGSEGAETGIEESAAAEVVAMQLPMNDDAAAARPASGRAHGDAATAMATGSEGAKAGAGENAAQPGVQQLPAEVWSSMSRTAKKHFLQCHNKGARK